jgi:hypothetical protein
MKSNMEKEQCSECGTRASSYEGVYFATGGIKRFLCSKCYNESISDIFGLDFDHLSFHPVTLKDGYGGNHTFEFQTRLFGDNVNIQALEIKENAPKGYEFSVNGHIEDDLFTLFTKLVSRLRRELERNHIESCGPIGYRITDQNIVRGRITWDDDTDGQIPCLIIDGMEISWHEFGRMLMAYEGFHFKLEILEGDEER